MMKKINILAISIILSVFLGSCMYPWAGSSPESAFSSRWEINYDTKIDLLNEWTTIDGKWHFKDGGELTIQSQSQTTDAYWISAENTLEIIINDKSVIYEVEVISEDEFVLTSETNKIVLTK